MKVKIKDLKPNPYRHIESYPVDEMKVIALEDSIKQTGFWDNILARQVEGDIQIAYGHHRLEALKRVMSPDEEVDIPVKELDDETMIKIMANENMEHWAATPAVIDQTVKVAREFLLSHPEIAQEYGEVHKSSATAENMIGAVLIARFLGWKQQKITDSLERLHLVSTGAITQLTIECFDTEGSARAFVDVIKEQEELGEPIPQERHMEIVRKFKASGNSRQILKEIVEETVCERPKYNNDKGQSIRILESKLYRLVEAIERLQECFNNIRYIFDKRTGIPAPWDELRNYSMFIEKLLNLEDEIQAFRNSHEKVPVIGDE